MDLFLLFVVLLVKFNCYDGVLNVVVNKFVFCDIGIEILGIDLCVYIKEKFVVFVLLLYLSCGSLRRVKYCLFVLIICLYCKEDMVELVCNSEIYSCGSVGSWLFVYLCCFCCVYVGVYLYIDLLLGILVDEVIREVRKEGKSWF